MRGHVTRKEGRNLWHPVVDLGPDPATGKRKVKWFPGHRTKKQAESELTRILGELQRGTFVSPSRLTLEAFLIDEWLPALAGDLRPGTVVQYRMVVHSYVAPRLGRLELQAVRPGHLMDLYRDLLADGRRGGGPLSAKTVHNVHTTLHRALSDAVRWGRLSRNPATLTTPPRRRHAEMRTWTPQELAAFLHHVREDRLYAAWVLLATTGMRRGEALGLRRDDVDLDARRVAVRRSLVLVESVPTVSEPKTAKGRRLVPLSSHAVTALRAHRRAQLEERVALGPGYQDEGFVFCREDGARLRPDTFSHAFDKHVRAAGFPHIRLHDLRHTWATLALQAGEHPKVVSEILGHANIAITLDTYSHAIPAMQEQAAERVATLIFER